MFLTGKRYVCSGCHGKMYYEAFCRNSHCTAQIGKDIEPLMAGLKQEISSTDTAIRLDEQTHNRLAEFTKPDETYPDLINRLMDGYNIAAAATPNKQQ
jgi:hypothetical protein